MPVDSLQKQEQRAAGAVTVEVKNPSPAEHDADDNADVDAKLRQVRRSSRSLKLLRDYDPTQ